MTEIEMLKLNSFYAVKVLGIGNLSPLHTLGVVFPKFGAPALFAELKRLPTPLVAKLKKIKWRRTTYKTVKRFSAKRNR